MRFLPSVPLLAVVFLIGTSPPAGASPGDPRVLQGVLAWAPGAEGAPFVVVRGDDGRNYVADVASAQRRGDRTPTVGDRVSLVGVEGARPWEMSALVMGFADSALSAVAPPPGAPASRPSAAANATPPAPPAPSTLSAPSASPPPAAARPWRRIHGRVESVAGKTLRLRAADGQVLSIDLSQLKSSGDTALRPGDEATVFVVAEPDQRLLAVGFVQSDPSQPSALPRQRP